MSKTRKYIIGLACVAITLYGIDFLYNHHKYSYTIDMQNYKRCMWIFNDSVIGDVDTVMYVGCLRRTDALYHYFYKKDYSILVWEFKDLKIADLNKIRIRDNIDLRDVNFSSMETLNSNSAPSISIKYGPFFTSGINLNTDPHSDSIKEISFANVKGIYGHISAFSLSTNNNETLVLYDFKNLAGPCLICFCKKYNRTYMLVVTCDNPFDESILRIFNLN